MMICVLFFFFQAEDGIRDYKVTGVQTCALPISSLPPELKISEFADQSLFVRAAISGVIKEAIIAACLTAIMILLFLGSWRSTIIIRSEERRVGKECRYRRATEQ